MIKLFFLLFFAMMAGYSANAQLARATFVNNSADPTIRAVDVYVTQSGSTYKVEDIPFQQGNNLDAVAFFGDLPASITVVKSDATDQSQALAFESFTPGADKAYVIMYNGVANRTGLVDNPDGRNIDPGLFIQEVTTTVTNPNKIGIYVSQGASDLQKGDLSIKSPNAALATDLSFRDFSSTLVQTDRKRVTLEFSKSGERSNVLASFDVDFATVSSQVVLLALSGYLDPASNNSTDTLALLIVGEDGTVVKRPVLSGSQTCKVQFIHASADPKFNQVDVYINGVKEPTMDNFTFRGATSFTTQPSGIPFTIAFTSPTATNANSPLATLTLGALRLGRNYQVIFTGVSDTLFKKNPNGVPIALDAVVAENALPAAPDQPNTYVRTGNFVTDGGAVSITSNTTSFAAQLGYKDITAEYVSVPPAVDTLWVRDLTTGARIKGYVTDLRGNIATTFLYTGFATPDSNKGGPARLPIIVNAGGTVNSTLQAVDSVTSVQDLVPANTWVVSPLPSSANISVRFPASTLFNNQGVVASVVASNGSTMLSQQMELQGAIVYANLQTEQLPTGTYSVVATDTFGRYLGSVQIVVLH